MITNIIQILHTTATYQAAVANLLVGEANFAAKQLNLQDWTPLEGTNGAIVEVMSAPLGVSGSVVTSNYVIEVKRGHVSWVSIRSDSELKKNEISPAELAKRPSLVDTNGAHALATQWLAELSVDVAKLEAEQPFQIIQNTWRDQDSSGGKITSNQMPVFRLRWGKSTGQYTSFNDPVSITLRSEPSCLKIGRASCRERV